MPMDTLVDRASAFFLNRNGNDRGADYLQNPDELAMLQTPMSPMVPFNGKAPNLMDTDLTTVEPLAGVAPLGGVLPVQNIQNDLRQLRAEMPFLVITMRPIVKGVFLAVAGTPANVTIESNVSLVRFRSSFDYYVSFDGQAAVPTATAPDGSLYKPEGHWYYCNGLNQISVVSPTVNAIVTLEFIGRVEQPG